MFIIDDVFKKTRVKQQAKNVFIVEFLTTILYCIRLIFLENTNPYPNA